MSPMRSNKLCMRGCSIIVLMAATSSAAIINGNAPFSVVRSTNNMIINNEANMASILEIRGGATRKRGGKSASLSSLDAKKRAKKTASGSTKVGKQPEKESPLNNTMQKYKAILPMTRLYITLVGISTLLGVILGEEAGQVILGLDPIRFIYGLELWRPITAASFLGPPSIGWLMSAYYLFEYGSSLERVYGTSQQLIFILTQIGILSMTAILFGQPFFGQSVITSMLHVLSRSMPHQKVKWLIFTVPYWTLPYGLMASDVLQGGAAAALPHVLGILSGHCYYFHKFVWPKMGGEDWLTAPDFLVRRLEPDSAANNAGRKSIESALKNRKKGKGRKLGA